MKPGDAKGDDTVLLLALAGGASVADAARTAGVSSPTAYRRLAAPGFARQLAEARSQMISQAVGRLARDCSTAADTLAVLLRADSETVRLGAARSLLELALKLHEAEAIEARITALEHAAEAPPEGARRAWGA